VAVKAENRLICCHQQSTIIALPLILRTGCRSAVRIDPLAFMNVPRRQFFHLAAGAFAAPAIARHAVANTYPSRPVRLLVAATTSLRA
jgi:hypothetical protein